MDEHEAAVPHHDNVEEIAHEVVAEVESMAEIHEVDAAHPDPHDAVMEVPAHGGGDAHGGGHAAPGPLDISLEMFLWTVGTFLVMAWVLAKFAWKPILDGLEKREADLRESVEQAETVRQELASIDAKREDIVHGADEQAKEIVARARRAGAEVERSAEEKGREQAAILLENANREIGAARAKAQVDLRRESVDTAIDLAGKLVGENLDDAKSRDLVDRLIAKM